MNHMDEAVEIYVYNVLSKKGGPCPMCYGAIKWAKIKNIFYANTREDAKNIGFDDNLIYDDIINKTQNMEKVNNKDAINAFQQWKNTKNKKIY